MIQALITPFQCSRPVLNSSAAWTELFTLLQCYSTTPLELSTIVRSTHLRSVIHPRTWMGDQNEINNAINLYVANAKNNRTAPKTVFYFLLKKSRRTISSTTQQRANGHNNKRNGRKVKRKRKKRYIFLLQPRKLICTLGEVTWITWRPTSAIFSDKYFITWNFGDT